MTHEEARKFGLNLLRGIMERNESYPVYADNVKQAIEALSAGSSEKPNTHEGLDEAAEKYAYRGISEEMKLYVKPVGDEVIKNFKAGAKWQKEQMLKEAVETVVSLDAGGFPFIEFGVGKFGLKVSDKVRVIVCKKED